MVKVMKTGKRTLIYTRTHNGDPDPATGEFGKNDCMGRVRDWRFDAVIGVGGWGAKAKRNKVAGKVNWIGIGPTRRASPKWKGSLVTFDHFLDFGTEGSSLAKIAPRLARRMFRVLMSDNLSSVEAKEVDRILNLAVKAPPSPGSRGSSRPSDKRRDRGRPPGSDPRCPGACR